MSKFVKYNGKTQCDYFSYPATFLKKKNIYEVLSERKLPNQTNLILKELHGEFASDWFLEIPIKLGTCTTVPSEKLAFFYKPINSNNEVQTSPVISVEVLSNSIFQVITSDTVYIVEKE